MRLKVKRFRQIGSTCGQTSLRAVLDYFGLKFSLSEILKGVRLYKTGTYIEDMALFAKSLGFKTKIITFDPEFFDPTWANLPQKSLLRKYKRSMKFKRGRKRKREKILNYLKKGEKYSLQIPSRKLLFSYLKKKIPPILCIFSTILRKEKRRKNSKLNDIAGKPMGHFVVLMGYENKKFIIMDPNSQKGGIKAVPEDLLLYSWYLHGGWMVVIQK